MNKDNNNDNNAQANKNEDPTTSSNLKKILSIAVQFINNKIDGVLNTSASVLDVDPQQSIESIVKEVGMKMYLVNKALSTPDGQKMLEELGKFSADIFKTTEKPLKEGQRVFNEMLQSQLATVEKLAWGALGLVPVVGDVSEVVRIANDMFRAFLKLAKTFATITGQGATAIEEMENKINQQKGLFVKMGKFVNESVTDLNKEVSGVVGNIQEKVDMENLTEEEKEKEKGSQEVKEEKSKKNMFEFFNAKKGGSKCITRTLKSKNDFLNLCNKLKAKTKKMKTSSRRKRRALTKRRRRN
jgi:hypothetical protein